MRSHLRTILLLGVILSLISMGGTRSSPTRAQAGVQAQPNFYFNDPTPLNGSYTSSGFDLNPSAIVTPDGNLWVAWESNRGGSYQIYYQLYNGITWTTPLVVSTAGYNAAPSLSVLTNGTIVLVWAAGTSGHDDHLYTRSYTNGAWKTITQLTSGTTYTDELPKTVVARDSRLWVFFERDNSTGPSTPPTRQIYYKTLTGGTWSQDAVLTTDNATNQQPTTMILRNGAIWVAWARNTTAGTNSTVYYRSFNGTKWTGDTPLTIAAPSFAPNLVQDRNGTIWLFWSQNMQLNATRSQDVIRYRSSTDAGQTWTTAANLTVWGDPTNPINNLSPYAVQDVDTTLYTFFASDAADPYGFGFHIYYIQSSPIYPVYAVGVSSVLVSPAMNYPYGDAPTSIATITVTVQNYGDQNENITVNVQASNKTSYTLTPQTATVLASLSQIFTFKWNVTGITPARYNVIVSIPPVTGETTGNILGNSMTVRSGVAVTYGGDVLRLGRVNINDEAVMGHCWLATPGSANWNPDCDILRKGIVNINDEAVAGGNWLKSI